MNASLRKASVPFFFGLVLAAAGVYAALALEGDAAIAGGVTNIVGARMALFCVSDSDCWPSRGAGLASDASWPHFGQAG